MRSVLVTEREYRHGHAHEEVRPDELLQMFGRAGRRGLDDVGYVLVAPERPRLTDARTLFLQRSRQVDWPSLISVMSVAADRGENPFEQAVIACERLFSIEHVPLGVEHSLKVGGRPCGLWIDADRARFANPRHIEILNSRNEWQEKPPVERRPLGEILVYKIGRWRPAIGLAETLEGIGEGTLCRLRETTPLVASMPSASSVASTASSSSAPAGRARRQRRYGRELAVATRDCGDPATLHLVKSLRRKLALPRESRAGASRFSIGRKISEEDFYRLLPTLFPSIGGGTVVEVVERRGTLHARLDYGGIERECFVDVHGAALMNPPERKDYPQPCRACDQSPICEHELSRGTSPAPAWRRLGLISADGAPTRRGIVFSFFHHGEGLAIAAALEDESYPVDELVYDLANLRAGHRFSETEFARGSRLASACREAYPTDEFPGYLESGLPPGYGDGAAEALRGIQFNLAGRHGITTDLLRAGDIERAYLEWRSLLRQISFAPDYEWPRWMSLRSEARCILEETAPPALHTNFPTLLPSQRRRCSHLLRSFR